MTRGSFLKNLFGAAIAATVGSNLDFVADLQKENIVKYMTIKDADGNTFQFVHNPIYDDPQFFNGKPTMESYRMVFLDFTND